MSFSPASDKMLKDLGMRFRKRAWPLGCRSSKSPRGPYQQTSIRDIEAGVAAARATTLVNITRVLDMEIDVGPGGEIVPAIKSMLQPDDDYLPACRRRRGGGRTSPTALTADGIQSFDLSLDDLPVCTLVRTPGDYNGFNLWLLLAITTAKAVSRGHLVHDELAACHQNC
ncbi:hypothetical protein ACVWWG_009522 [Bradyrhizobium sp. LB7.2]